MNTNKLKGGKGDNLSAKNVDKKELLIGIQVEHEHTKNSAEAKEIACDHLSENPTYYSELIKAGLVDEPKALELYKKYFKEDEVEEAFGGKYAHGSTFDPITVNKTQRAFIGQKGVIGNNDVVIDWDTLLDYYNEKIRNIKKENTMKENKSKSLLEKLIKEEIEIYVGKKSKTDKPEITDRKEKIKIEEDETECNKKFNAFVDKVQKAKKFEDLKSISVNLDEVPKVIKTNLEKGLYMKHFGPKDKEDIKQLKELKEKKDDKEAELLYFVSKGFIKKDFEAKRDEKLKVEEARIVNFAKRLCEVKGEKFEFSPAVQQALTKLKQKGTGFDIKAFKKTVNNEWDPEALEDLQNIINDRVYFLKTLIDKVNQKQVKGFGKDIKGVKF